MAETTPQSTAEQVNQPPHIPGSTNDPNQALTIMLQIQQQQQQQQIALQQQQQHQHQQQIAMQQQITQLLSHLTTPGNANPPRTQQHAQRCKPARPVIEADCTDNKWVIFKDAWTRYKQMTRLTEQAEIRNELRSACTGAVNELLFNFVGPDQLDRATEEELLNHIRSVAVKAVHPEVYRQQFSRIKQSDDESITPHFVSR